MPSIESRLSRLQPYPFERLRQWFAGVTPNPALAPINLSIGEPKHPTPALILDALAAGGKGLAHYPTTIGAPALRDAIAAWLVRRHGLAALDPATEVLPVLGSREALFAFAQTVIDGSRVGATVVMPNPFYQIYEGAALLAGALPYYVNAVADRSFAIPWHDVPASVWTRTQFALRVLAGQPDRPGDDDAGMKWLDLLAVRSIRFLSLADECYSEVYFSTNPRRRWARLPPPMRWDATAIRASFPSAAFPSDPTRPACVPDTSPATLR